MNLTLFKWTLLYFLFLIYPTQAQESSNSYYLNDGGFSSKNNILKLDFSGPLRGQYQVLFEHFFSNANYTSGEIGFGVLNHNFKSSHINIGKNNFQRFDLSEPGYVISGALHLHPTRSFDRSYYGFKTSYHTFSEINSIQLSMYKGFMFPITDHLLLEGVLEMDIEAYNPRNPDDDWYDDVDKYRWGIDLILRFGFMF